VLLTERAFLALLRQGFGGQAVLNRGPQRNLWSWG